MNRLFRISCVTVGAVLCSTPLLAAEGDIDITPATGLLTKMQTAIESYWTSAEPFLIAVVGLVVVAALIWAGVRLFKGGASKISGR